MQDRLIEKWAIVTGGNSGIGKEVALGLVAKGARVIIAARNEQKSEEAVQEIRSQYPGAIVEFWKLDLGTQADVRRFAQSYKASKRPLHLLVANAGANFPSKRKTEDGVPLQCQVNYLGHYTLARLLESILIQSAPSRIISVSSATHRYGAIRGVRDFLRNTEDATYADTKLAQVLFTYEAQRRLAHLGVNASVVDPGGVKTGVWKGRFAKPPFSWYINTFLSPASIGAVPVLHAATADYDKEAQQTLSVKHKTQYKMFRFYAKGAFAARFLTSLPGPRKENKFLDMMRGATVQAAIAIASAIDWPVERFSGGRLFSVPRRTPSAALSYDQYIARDLWDRSAEIAGVPAECGI